MCSSSPAVHGENHGEAAVPSAVLSGAEIKPQLEEAPMQVDAPRRKLQPVEKPHWSRLLAGTAGHREEFMRAGFLRKTMPDSL